jgi:hypothetical protein
LQPFRLPLCVRRRLGSRGRREAVDALVVRTDPDVAGGVLVQAPEALEGLGRPRFEDELSAPVSTLGPPPPFQYDELVPEPRISATRAARERGAVTREPKSSLTRVNIRGRYPGRSNPTRLVHRLRKPSAADLDAGCR